MASHIVLNTGGDMILHHVLTSCGSAAAVFVVDARRSKPAAPQFDLLRMSRTAPKSPWKMTRAELIQQLEDLDIPVRYEWTVPELRATLLETLDTKGDHTYKAVGISHMSLDALKEKCSQEGILLPPRPSRGLLMKLLRENTPPTGEEKVCFGCYKGFMYKEVNWSYLNWAMKEVETNPNHSPDLARLARWAQAEKSKPPRGGTSSVSGDPEHSAVLPIPPEALPKAKPKMEKNNMKTARTSRTRPLASDSEGFSLVSEPEMSTEDQIKDMESRLQVLKAVKAEEDKKDKGYWCL